MSPVPSDLDVAPRKQPRTWKQRAWDEQPGFPWQRGGEKPKAILSRNGWPFGLTPDDLCVADERVEDAVMICEAVEVMAGNGGGLDAGFLLSSVGPDPSGFVRRVHERHAVSWNRPADRRGTIHGLSWGVGNAIADCQVALGVSAIPIPTGPGQGAYVIWREPCFTQALFAGRSLEEIAAIVAMNELRKGARLAPWLRKEPGAIDPVEDRDFWLGWPGNGPRLLRACRDLVTRRIGWKGGSDAGEIAGW